MTLLITCIGFYYLTNFHYLVIERPGVVVRSRAATNSEGLSTIPEGSKVSQLAHSNNWIKIRYDGSIEGWIPEWLLKDTNLQSDNAITAEFTKQTPVYQEADDKADPITTIPSTSYIPINYEGQGWSQITYEGEPVFVKTEDITIRSTPDVETKLSQEKEKKLSEEARQKQIEELSNIAIMRKDNEFLYEEASIDSAVVYATEYQQEFTIIDSVSNDDGVDFYLVEDLYGVRGYVNQLAISEPVYSIDHRNEPINRALANATIVLDPGHGGEDPGTISLDQKHYEKNYVLPTAMTLKKTLEALGAKVIMIRTEDVFVDLEERVTISNESNADLFISIHFDSSYDTSFRGITTYYYHPDDDKFAYALNSGLAELNYPNQGVQFGNFQVIRENNLPSLLLELGYITNQEDLSLMQTSDYQQALADGIANGLVTYFDQINLVQ